MAASGAPEAAVTDTDREVMMPLQEFTDVRRRVDREPRLGVQSKGRVSINAAGIEALGKPSHVVLLFDPEEMQLGVRAAAPKEPHAYQLTKTGKETDARTVSLVALFRHYGVDGDEYVGSYVAEVMKLGGHTVLAISLTRPADRGVAAASTALTEDDIPF